MKKKFYLLAVVALYLSTLPAQAQTLPAGPTVIVAGDLINTGKMISTLPIDLQKAAGDSISILSNTVSGDLTSAGMKIATGTELQNAGKLTVTIAPTYAEGITIPATTSANIAGILPIQVTFVPAITTNKNVVWTSSNPTVVTFDTDGNLLINSDGEAQIVCQSTDGSNVLSNICVVKVEIKVPANHINVSGSTTTLTTFGSATQYTAQVVPATASQAVTWSSSNPNVATVNAATGVITAVGHGQSTIYATNITTATFPATGKLDIAVNISATNIIVSGTNDALTSVGATTTFTAKVEPAGSTQTVEWSSQNTNVATVNTSGMVTAVAYGTATIVALTHTPDNVTVSGSKDIHVNIPATQVTVSGGVSTITTVEGTTTFTATVAPATACQTVKWSSSNIDVATVNEYTGVITAVDNGTATITATSDLTGATLTGTKNISVVLHTVNFMDGSTLFAKRQAASTGGDISLPPIPTKSGYVFAGWYESGGTLPVLFPYYRGGTAPSTTTLTASWISESDMASATYRENNYRSVMKNSIFNKNMRIVDMAMLGAHDAYTHLISKNQPLDPIDENINNIRDFLGNNWVGHGIMDAAIAAKHSNIADMSKGQVANAYELLMHGIRLLDGRISRGDGQNWYTAHGIISGALSEYVKQVLQFLEENPREVVIFDVQRIFLKDSNYDVLLAHLKSITYNEKTLFSYVNYSTSTPFSQLTYSDVLPKDDKTGGVILLITGTAKTGDRSRGVTYMPTGRDYNAQVYNRDGNARQGGHNTNELSTLVSRINDQAASISNYDQLRINEANLTPQDWDMINGDNNESMIEMGKKAHPTIVNHANLRYWFSKMPVLWTDYADDNETGWNTMIIPIIHGLNLNLQNP